MVDTKSFWERKSKMSRMGAEIFQVESGLYDWQMVYDHFATRIKKFVRICGNLGSDGEYLTLAEALIVIRQREELLDLAGGSLGLDVIREILFEVGGGDPLNRSLELIEEVLSIIAPLTGAIVEHRAKFAT